MEFKLITTVDKISLIFICIGVISQIILQILLHVLYFFISATFIGVGFILFSISQLIESSHEDRKEKRSPEGLLFFHDRPLIISILSLIVGIIFLLGEFFYQRGYACDIFEMIIIGDIFRAIMILSLVILSTIMIFLSLLYKKNEKHEMRFVLPEILLIITLFALLSVRIKDYFFYSCYSIFQNPTCFPTEHYIITTSFFIFIAIFFIKLVYLVQLRREFVSEKQHDLLELRKEGKEQDSEITSRETQCFSLFKLVKEAFTPISIWSWKYNSKKYFIV